MSLLKTDTMPANKDPNKNQSLAEPSTDHQLMVSTRFMETFEIVRPINPGADFGLFLNAEGNLDIYSVGTLNKVYRMRQNSKEKAPWTQTNLDITARMLSMYTGTTDNNTPNILGVNDDGKLTLSTYDKELNFYRQQVSQPELAKKKIIQFLSTKKYDNVYANVILDDNTVGNSFMKPDGTWASRDWVILKDGPNSTTDAKAYQIAMCHNNPVQNALYAIGTDKVVLFSDSSSRFSYFTPLPGLKAMDLSVIQDKENRLNIFAISAEDNGIYVKREKKYSTSGKIEWDPWALVSKTTKMKNIRTTINAAGIVEVFGIENDPRGTLFITREIKNEKGERIGWTELFPLANPVPNSQFQVAQNAQGFSEAYTVSQYSPTQSKNKKNFPYNANVTGEVAYLYRFWQSPETTQWFSIPVMVEESAEMVPVPTHSVEIQVLYPNGAGYSFADVRINTSITSTLRINGLAYITSPLQTVSIKADAAGMVVFNYGTASLTAPSFFINTVDMLDGEGITIEPNQMLQLKMHEVTEESVLEARGAEGQLLIQGTPEERKQNAQAISQVMQQTMTIGMPGAATSSVKPRYLSGNRYTHGLHYHPRGSTTNPYKLDMKDVPQQHWRVVFDDKGGLQFENLDADSAQTCIANLSATASGGSFLGIEWGDLWNSIKQGFGKLWEGLKQIIVTTIINPITKIVETIKVVAEFIIDGISFLYDKVVEFFQQAFDVIEGIWAKIKVFFQDLYTWLAFFFNFADIGRSADAVRHSINTTLDFTVLGINAVKVQVMRAMEGLSAELQKAVDEIISKMPGEATIGQTSTEFETPAGQVVYKDGSTHNVMLNAYQENYQGAKPAGAGGIVALQGSGSLLKVEELVQMLVALADNFQFGDGKQAFEEAVAYFSAIGEHPDQALNLVVKGAIKMMEASMLFVLDVAKGVILSIFDLVADIIILVKELLNEEWEIPFVSQLYKFFSGKSLTFRAIDLISYIIAIPSTLIYKIVENKAPFPTDASVQEFKQAFTAQWLAEQSGITPQGKATAMAKKWSGELVPQDIIGPIFTVFNGGLYFVRILTETMNIAAVAGAKLSGQTDLPYSSLTIGIANLTCLFGSAAFSTPWALKADAGGFSCSDAKGLSNTIWLSNLLCGPGRGALLLATNIALEAKGKPPLPSEVNDLTVTLWGAVNLGLQSWLISMGGYKSTALEARAIMATFGSQLFRFALIGPLVVPSYGITAFALQVIVIATNVANGIITLQTVGSKESLEVGPREVWQLAPAM